MIAGAVGIALVVVLVVAVVSVGRWTYTELRNQARGPQTGREAIPGPAVIGPPPESAPPTSPPPAPARPASPGPGTAASDPPTVDAAVTLAIPVDGIAAADLYPSFDDQRGGRLHEAIDIMAPRGTPVRAATDGRIAKLFTSDAGGLTIYQFDREERLACYYAHLDRYASGLEEGADVRRGDVIGYVGSTGNASADAPHLHFAVFVLGPEKRWWEGRAIDPYPMLRGQHQ